VQPTPPAGADEFQVFLTDIAQTVAQHVEEWRLRIGEAVAFWKGEGYRTSVLERAMGLPRVTDVEGLLTTYTSAVEHLRTLEAQAAAVDPQLGSAEVFRDPERVGEAEELVDRALAGQTPPPGPSAAFSRETLEVGTSNQIAVGAADAVIEEPGRRYNPLFVHGPVGTGKTHLVNAIGNGLIEASGGAMTVAYVSAQQFVDELIAALQEGTIERWRARYRAVDALVVDDVHAIAGKERTQDELFHLFNAMTNEGKQVVLASDRAPKEIVGLEPRLRSRFEGGLVVAVQHPDRVLRKKMFARLLSQAGAPSDPELLSYLAERQAVSVREVSGLVQRLLSAADLADAELTLDFAKQELEGGDVASAHAPAASMAIADPFFLDEEKVVWDWPDVAGRIIEELR
jgi:chromosomal replication initiator protein